MLTTRNLTAGAIIAASLYVIYRANNATRLPVVDIAALTAGTAVVYFVKSKFATSKT